MSPGLQAPSVVARPAVDASGETKYAPPQAPAPPPPAPATPTNGRDGSQEQRSSPAGPVAHATQGGRNQGRDDQRVEDQRQQDGTLGRRQLPDVQRFESSDRGDEPRRNNGAILRPVVGD